MKIIYFTLAFIILACFLFGAYWLHLLTELRRNPIGKRCKYKADGVEHRGIITGASRWYVLVQDYTTKMHKVKRNEIYLDIL